MKSLKIGNVKLKNPVFLAPMVDVSDLPYRLICRKCGAGMAYTEMIYCSAVLHKNAKTLRMMKTCRKDKPIGIQIAGGNIEEFRKIIPYLKKYDLVDINCGCPSLKITSNFAGSYLLKSPEKIGNIVKVLKKAGLTVSVKVRLGFDDNNILKVVKAIEMAGADAIGIHARLATQGMNINADWKWIEKVKKTIKIPVIGNGDVFSGKDAKKMLKICDGVMIARGAIGDPLIFSRILNYLKTGREEKSDYSANLKLFKEYLRLTKEYNMKNLMRAKYIGGKFIKNFDGAAKIRAKFIKLKTFEDIEKFMIPY